MENGSPILGEPNAPITLIEFGDYQCFFCNKFFHETEDENLNKNPLICQGLPLQGKEINTLICNISMSVVKPINLLSINTQYVGFSFLIQYDYKTEYS